MRKAREKRKSNTHAHELVRWKGGFEEDGMEKGEDGILKQCEKQERRENVKHTHKPEVHTYIDT